MFTYSKRDHKLKQWSNLRLQDENYAFFVVSLLVHKMGEREGALVWGGRLVLADRRGGLFEGGAPSRGRALIWRFTVNAIKFKRHQINGNKNKNREIQRTNKYASSKCWCMLLFHANKAPCMIDDNNDRSAETTTRQDVNARAIV